jgi:hypothetical protein
MGSGNSVAVCSLLLFTGKHITVTSKFFPVYAKKEKFVSKSFLNEMEVSGQPQTPTDLPPVKIPWYPLQEQPELLRTNGGNLSKPSPLFFSHQIYL